MLALWVLCTLLLPLVCHCFYIPGVAPVEFKSKDPVDVKASSYFSGVCLLLFLHVSNLTLSREDYFKSLVFCQVFQWGH